MSRNKKNLQNLNKEFDKWIPDYVTSESTSGSCGSNEVYGKDRKIDLKREADKLLTKKKEKKVDPNYKPQKASGYTRHERRKIRRAGERLVRDIKNKKEKPISHYDPGV